MSLDGILAFKFNHKTLQGIKNAEIYLHFLLFFSFGFEPFFVVNLEPTDIIDPKITFSFLIKSMIFTLKIHLFQALACSN